MKTRFKNDVRQFYQHRQNDHLAPQAIEHEKATTYGIGNAGTEDRHYHVAGLSQKHVIGKH